MNLPVVFRSAALLDLQRIWSYTFDRYGLQQAEEYLSRLRLFCDSLGNPFVRNPEIVPASGIRSALFESNYRVLYREKKHALEIGRIVHCANEPDLQRALRSLRRKRRR